MLKKLILSLSVFALVSAEQYEPILGPDPMFMTDDELKGYYIAETDQTFRVVSRFAQFLSKLVDLYDEMEFEKKENIAQGFIDWKSDIKTIIEKYKYDSELVEWCMRFLAIHNEYEHNRRSFLRKYRDMGPLTDLQEFDKNLELYNLFFTYMNDITKLARNADDSIRSKLLDIFKTLRDSIKNKVIDLPEAKKIVDHFNELEIIFLGKR